MNQQSSGNLLNMEQRIQQLLVYAKTFRHHQLILYGKKQVSPYDLVLNGFVNKNFKQQQRRQLNQQQEALKQVSCICRVPQCSKNIKFNCFQHQNFQNQDQIESLMTQHQENCSFFKKQPEKLNLPQIFEVAHLLFDKILETYKKDQFQILEGLTVSWDLFQKLFSNQENRNHPINMVVQCYKFVDNQFNVLIKRFSKSILLSLFGWRLFSSKLNASLTFKCHYCGKKVEKQIGQSFNFYNQHNSWCLISKGQYSFWKLALKKKYIVQKQKSSLDKISWKTYLLPKTQSQIQSKQIRYQIFQLVKPELQKIDQLFQQSIEFVKRQKHLDQQFYKKSEGNHQIDDQQHIARFKSLNLISQKCKETIKNFINSIQTRRV